MPLPRPVALMLVVAILCLIPFSLAAQPAIPGSDARELAGLWEAKLRFGPDTRGPLVIYKEGATWRADIAGRSVDVRVSADTLTFELPAKLGHFRGHFVAKRQAIFGHWYDALCPVTLTRIGKTDVWRGTVNPIADEFTWYLKVEPRADGTMRAFLKNPERNQGYFMEVASLERDGKTVRLVGTARGGKPAEVLSEGSYADGTLSLPLRGGTYDFARVADGEASDFYPRLHPNVGASYHYSEPPQLDDGWPVATPEEVGLSRDALERFVRTIIDTSIDSVSVLDTHGVVIARHGKLVLEEYFHGENRDKPHDSRSAAKSITSVLLGAVIQSGVREPGGAPLSAQSHVYQVMNGGTFPAGLDPRKQRMTLEHLLTMSSGLDANDGDENSPGNEDKVQEGNDPNWWRLTLNLNMVREPGEKAAYASMGANLVGAIMRTAAHRTITELFHDLIAEPMQIRSYWLGAQTNGEPYMGGGMRLLPRDFAKFPQLLLNGGTWNGHRVLSAEWARRSTSPLVTIGVRVKSGYGYLWWLIDYPYQGKTITAYYCAGNGGQIWMAIPALDLVFAHFGGNYADNVMFQVQRKMVPEFVLPAVTSLK